MDSDRMGLGKVLSLCYIPYFRYILGHDNQGEYACDYTTKS